MDVHVGSSSSPSERASAPGPHPPDPCMRPANGRLCLRLVMLSNPPLMHPIRLLQQPMTSSAAPVPMISPPWLNSAASWQIAFRSPRQPTTLSSMGAEAYVFCQNRPGLRTSSTQLTRTSAGSAFKCCISKTASRSLEEHPTTLSKSQCTESASSLQAATCARSRLAMQHSS